MTMAETAQFTIGAEASCSDGPCGQVRRVIVDPVAEAVTHLVIDPGSHGVTHVLLPEGHLWGRREVAIPVSAVASTGDGIRLTITKQQVQNLPPADIDHSDESTGGPGGQR